MNKLIILVTILLVAVHFNANAQININTFKVDKMNMKAKKAKKDKVETYKRNIKRAAFNEMVASGKTPKEKTVPESLTQAEQAYSDALDAAKKQLDELKVNPSDTVNVNQVERAVRKAQRRYERLAKNMHSVALKLTVAGTPAITDTGVEAESAPGSDEVTAIDPNISFATAGTLTITATTTDSPASRDWTGFIFGSGTAASLQTPSKPSGNLTVGGLINFRGNTIMFAYNPMAATSTDTGNLVKSFLFPEITARAFVIEYDRVLFNGLAENNGGLSINYFINLSTSYIESSSSNTITPYNMLTGFRFSMHKDLSNASSSDARNLKNMTFSISPHFSVITIDPKDFNNYDSTFKPSTSPNAMKKIQTTVQAVGAKVSFEIGSLKIFFDYKYIINGGTDQVFNTGIYTLGASVNTQLFSF